MAVAIRRFSELHPVWGTKIRIYNIKRQSRVSIGLVSSRSEPVHHFDADPLRDCAKLEALTQSPPRLFNFQVVPLFCSNALAAILREFESSGRGSSVFNFCCKSGYPHSSRYSVYVTGILTPFPSQGGIKQNRRLPLRERNVVKKSIRLKSVNPVRLLYGRLCRSFILLFLSLGERLHPQHRLRRSN
ncbi:Hypothetical protein NTJ_00785 [Nesidiocoris tenuis]|uniref:Uncharacterized protein n=1 Tax=Nesidiocoris tenuis TaxID=355587 RepID=A0ABN7A9M2_9HEMI|nr:Hypothetical protein NTJ_00785 [Nesidiocoris tenuis]